MSVAAVLNALDPFVPGLLAVFGVAVAVFLVERVIYWFVAFAREHD